MKKHLFLLLLFPVCLSVFPDTSQEEVVYINFDYYELQGRDAIGLFLEKQVRQALSDYGCSFFGAHMNGNVSIPIEAPLRESGILLLPFGPELLLAGEKWGLDIIYLWDFTTRDFFINPSPYRTAYTLMDQHQLKAGIFRKDFFALNFWWKKGVALDYSTPWPYTGEDVERIGGSLLIDFHGLSKKVPALGFLESYEILLNYGDDAIKGYHNVLGINIPLGNSTVKSYISYGYDQLHDQYFGSLNITDSNNILLGGYKWEQGFSSLDSFMVTFSPANLYMASTNNENVSLGHLAGIGWMRDLNEPFPYDGLVIAIELFVNLDKNFIAKVDSRIPLSFLQDYVNYQHNFSIITSLGK